MIESIRGLSLPNSLEQPSEPLFNVAERADLAVVALGSLGLVADKGAATEHIGLQMQTLHDTVWEQSQETALEAFLAIELTDKFGLTALVAAFDSRQKEGTYVYEPLWDQYSSTELNSRSIGKAVEASSSEGMSGHARAMLLDGDHATEPGLYLLDKAIKDQIKGSEGKDVLNPADYIMLNAQRREQGQDLLDTRTYTRFPQLDAKRADGVSFVPYAISHGGRLSLDGSYDWAYSFGGVRFSVGPKAKA